MKQAISFAAVCGIVFAGGCSAPKPELLPNHPTSKRTANATRRVATDRVVIEGGSTKTGAFLELVYAGRRYELSDPSDSTNREVAHPLTVSEDSAWVFTSGTRGAIWKFRIDDLPPHRANWVNVDAGSDHGRIMSLSYCEILYNDFLIVGYEDGAVLNRGSGRSDVWYQLPGFKKILWAGVASRFVELIAVDSELTIYRWKGGQKPIKIGKLLGGVKNPTAFALSPSGQQMAVIHEEFLTVFELDPKPGHPLFTKGGFPELTAIYYNELDILSYSLPDGRRGTIE